MNCGIIPLSADKASFMLKPCAVGNVQTVALNFNL